QTSPIRMFFSSVLSPSLIITEYGPPALGVATFTFQLPDEEFTLYSFPFQEVVMVMAFLVSDVPQMLTSALRCKTIPSENTDGNKTLALLFRLSKNSGRIPKESFSFITKIYWLNRCK